MSGKSYSQREMKTIVDYLVEHQAYGECKGRKMWMDFASSRLTKRTWQSLKETFLKRILPDITNPYYRLDIDQIHSFKRGVNLIEKNKNKLELEPAGEKTNNKDAKGDNEQPSTSNNNEENASGEDTTNSKLVHNRASTETLILENCYETAEDIQKDLERSTDNEEVKDKPNNKPPLKSVRDFIVYSEPLTPMLQEVLDDFASDEESDRMLIDENYVSSERRSNSPELVASQSILKPRDAADKAKPTSKDSEEITKDGKEVEENNEQLQKIIETHDESEKNIEAGSLSQFEDVMVLVDKALAKHLVGELNTQSKSQEKVVDLDSKVRNSNEASSGMTDSLLPNNQEGVNSETFKNASPILPMSQMNGDQASKKRKRSISTEIIEKNKTKKQKEPEQSVADRKHSDAVEIVVVNVATKVDADDEPNSDTNKKVDHNNIDGPKAVNSENKRDKSPSLSLKKKHNLTMNSNKSSKKQNPPNPATSQIISSDSSDIIVNRSAQVENPCLKSVSLYAEQFSSTKYSDSDLDIVEDNGKEKNSKKAPEPPKKNLNVATKEKAKDVILLQSRSNSTSDNEPPLSAMKQRRNKIMKVFGLTNGGGSHSRRMNGRKRTSSHRSHQYVSSESSEWTSASDSEFVSPPRGRRNRYARKYLKPQSARVMSLEGGDLFVMLGKKIFPLTKHGKTVKNYLTCLPDSEEEEDSYWKNKYVEERKRTAELKKILQKSKQNDVQIIEESESPVEVPLPQAQRQQRPSIAKESVDGNELVTRKETALVIPDKPIEEKTLKIKFTKNDQEIQLEGHWQHINPVLAQVVSMFHAEPAAAKQPDPANCVELSSGTTTPRPLAVDTGVKEKINKIESDIFKEIVQKDEEEVQPTPEENASSKDAVDKDTNVTVRKRRGRAKKQPPPAVTRSSSVSTERSLEPETKLNSVDKEQGVSDSASSVTERRTRTPRKLLEVATAAATKQVNRRKASPAKATENEDEEVFYKFPSPMKRGKKSTNVTNNAIETDKQ